MGQTAIVVDGLGKQYRIGRRRKGYATLRESIVETVHQSLNHMNNLLTGVRNESKGKDDWMWALKDVSFEVHQGEVVGIIGSNGAGKSTLLKILSQITEPTLGEVRLHGRVGALLEVGTGFHPELTGRENVYLNGAILGMKKVEISRQFDEIVAFAEVDRFIDTPVKHYSSGMYLRLAFAVAAHLEPEILIVDEVLAVGDAAFQKKCLGKMEGVAKQGRTVLFVSHSMPSITRLCHRAILLHEGRLVHDGDARQVVRAYLNSGMGTTAEREWKNTRKAPGGDIAQLLAVRIRMEEGGETADTIDIRKAIGLEMEYRVLKPGYKFMASFTLWNEEGVCLFSLHDQDPSWRRRPRPVGCYRSTSFIPGNFFAEGTMFVGAALITIEPMTCQFDERNAVAFQVVDSPDGDSARSDWAAPMDGVVRPLMKWNTVLLPDDLQTTRSGTVPAD